MAVEQLIGALRAEAELDSSGSFSLDAEKAREKMRRYQLANPQAWVTEIVQAAVLMGATRVDLAMDADDSRISFDGPAVTAQELEDLWAVVFSAAPGNRVAALRQLALGLNGALGLEPRWVRMRSRGESDDEGVVAELRPDRPDVVEVAKLEPAGTTIHVKKRLRPGTIIDFFRNIGPGASEESWVRERCRYAQLPIVLEGVKVSHGPVVETTVCRVAVEGDDIVGEGGFDTMQSAVSRVHLLSSGVLVNTEVVQLGPLPFLAVVEGHGLKKNVAQTGFVRDAAFDAVMQALLAAREKAMAELCRIFAMRDPHFPLSPGRMLSALRKELLGFTNLAPLTAGDRDLYPGIVATAQIWPTAAADTLLSLDQIVAIASERGEMWYCSRDYRSFQVEEDLHKIVLLRSKEQRKGFQVLFGKRAKNVTRLLGNQIKREQNRKQWRARDHEASLGGGRFQARIGVRAPGVRGEVGIRHLARTANRFLYVKDGHLLYRLELEMPVPALEVVLEADFRANKNYDGVWKDATLAEALLAVVGVLPELFEKLALAITGDRVRKAEGTAEVFSRFFVFITRDDPSVDFLEAYGFSRKSAAGHVERIAGQHQLRIPDLGPASRSPLLHVPCFETVLGARVSLAEIRRDQQHRGGIAVVAEDFEEEVALDELILRLNRCERRTLELIFGEAIVEDASVRLEQEAARLEFMSRPQQSLRVDGSALAIAAVNDRGISGQVAILDPAVEGWEQGDGGPGKGRLRVMWMQMRRTLATEDVDWPYGPMWAVVDSGELKPTAAWDGVEAGPGRETALGAVLSAVPELLGELGRVLPRCDRKQREMIRHQVLEALLVPEHDRGPASAVYEALRGVAVLECIAGGQASTDDVEDQLRAAGAVAWVPRDGISVGPTPEGRLVLELGKRDLVCLRRLFAGSKLVNSLDELLAWRQTNRLQARQVVTRIGLLAGETVVKTVIDDPVVSGEVGLRAGFSGDRSGARMQIFVQHRPVTEMEFSDLYPLAAAVNDDRLRLDYEAAGVQADEALAELISLVQGHLPALLEQLADEWPTMDEQRRRRAWLHALGLLVRRVRNPLDPVVVQAEAVCERLARLHGFSGADGGTYSVQDLERAFAAVGEIRFLHVPDPAPFEDPDHIVVVVSGFERRSLDVLFDKVVDHRRAWRQRQLEREPPAGRSAEVADLSERPPGLARQRRREAVEGPSPQSAPELLGSMVGRLRGLFGGGEAEEVKPPPPKPARKAVSGLVQAVRAELSALRDLDTEALGGLDLDGLRCVRGRSSLVATVDEGGPRLHRSNRLVEEMILRFEDDPVGLAYLAAAVITAANRERPSVDDAAERRFVHLLVERMLAARAAGAEDKP